MRYIGVLRMVEAYAHDVVVLLIGRGSIGYTTDFEYPGGLAGSYSTEARFVMARLEMARLNIAQRTE